MSEIAGVVVSFFIGALSGAGYFAGLFWTVTRLTRARHPGRLMLASYFLRSLMAGVIFAILIFYFTVWGVVAALLGFWLSRAWMTRWKFKWAEKRMQRREP